MKKLGFTLTEVLLSMAIIGVVASLTAPSLINMMPNKDKMQTLKYQKLISEINADLLNNRTLYPESDWKVNGELTNGNIPEYDVLLEQSEKNIMKKNYYAYFLMDRLEDAELKGTPSSSKVEFTMPDGSLWIVETMNGQRPKTITIDMNGSSEGPNAFGSASQKYPDKIFFSIDKSASDKFSYTGYAECDERKDPITCRYMNCPYYMNNRKLDYECISKTTGECACNK